jgi:hypothetical protein
MGDYFGLDRVISIILAIFPITAWVCGIITRIQDGHVIAGILRIFSGIIIWIIDLILMIMKGSILRILNV